MFNSTLSIQSGDAVVQLHGADTDLRLFQAQYQQDDASFSQSSLRSKNITNDIRNKLDERMIGGSGHRRSAHGNPKLGLETWHGLCNIGYQLAYLTLSTVLILNWHGAPLLPDLALRGVGRYFFAPESIEEE
ncbi:hypothetical protein FANTH_7047 [Fusarium anthophilum]|uniref:Uncharacterized protein n=1 Tax=Fusarium anthophilum TaxID=48485 RepID=A0A8H4ZGR4_9HYPO|nr:hypothetical protein FANTH_7047 [Fusarium anthophilum]